MAEIVAKRSPGRPRKSFPSSQGLEILELIRAGHGRKMVCLKIGMSYDRFLQLVRADPEFEANLRTAEGMREEACEHQLFKMAVGICDTPIRLRAAIAYLGRRERVEAARRGREKARGRKADAAVPPGSAPPCP